MTGEETLSLQCTKRLLNVETVASREMHMPSVYQNYLNVVRAQWIHDCWPVDDMVRYNRDFPDIAVNMTVDHGGTLISMMYANILDLAITAYNINTNSLISQFYKRSKTALVEKKEQYSCLQKGIRREDLLNLPSTYSDIWDNYLSDTSEHLLLDERIYCIRCNILGGAKGSCITGLGCCFLPADLVKHGLEAEILVEIPVGEISTWYISLYVTYSRTRLGSTAMGYFLELSPQMTPK